MFREARDELASALEASRVYVGGKADMLSLNEVCRACMRCVVGYRLGYNVKDKEIGLIAVDLRSTD